MANFRRRGAPPHVLRKLPAVSPPAAPGGGVGGALPPSLFGKPVEHIAQRRPLLAIENAQRRHVRAHGVPHGRCHVRWIVVGGQIAYRQIQVVIGAVSLVKRDARRKDVQVGKAAMGHGLDDQVTQLIRPPGVGLPDPARPVGQKHHERVERTVLIVVGAGRGAEAECGGR